MKTASCVPAFLRKNNSMCAAAKKKLRRLVFLVATATWIAAGCSEGEKDETSPENNTGKSSTEDTAGKTADPADKDKKDVTAPRKTSDEDMESDREKTNADAENESGNKSDSVLDSALAGRWYPADRGKLRTSIEDAVQKATVRPCALVLPHAGYRFSLHVAAAATKHLEGNKYDRVVIIGPTHHFRMKNKVSVPAVSRYRTPLGNVPLDRDFIDELNKLDLVGNRPAAHKREHSVQIEVPLMQHILDDFKLVPVVVGQLSEKAASKIGRHLLKMIDQDTLVVVSSDFTHFGPRYRYQPFNSDVPKKLRQLDLTAVKRISSKDPATFRDFVDKTGATICGKHAIGILLNMLGDSNRVHFVKRDTSARMTGNYNNSVSYVSLAVTGQWPAPESIAKADAVKEKKRRLSDKAKDRLLKLARKSIRYYLNHDGERPQLKDLNVTLTPDMKRRMGAFVSLHKKGRLRGCIGEIVPRRELYKAVMAHAVNAAVNDRRFRPLEKSDLERVTISISALTAPHKVDSYKEIQLGRHGIVLKKGDKHAVYLPHVAVEQGWDMATTLSHLSRKAGLSPDAWKEDTNFLVFQAADFKEDGKGDSKMVTKAE